MGARTRVMHESLLKLIVAGTAEISMPNIRYFHSEAWCIRPDDTQEMFARPANWRLHWREPELVSTLRRTAIDQAAREIGALYDVIW